MDLCKYKNLFGELNTGVHSYRVFDIAIFDVLATVIFGFIFHQIVIIRLLNIRKNCVASFFIVLIVLFALGILLHRLFCVRSTVDKMLFNK